MHPELQEQSDGFRIVPEAHTLVQAHLHVNGLIA